MKKNLDEILKYILETLKKTEAFAIKQAPNFVKDLYVNMLIERAGVGLINILGPAILYAANSWLLKMFLSSPDQTDRDQGPVLSALFFMAIITWLTTGVIISGMSLLKLIYSPKIEMLFHAKGILSRDSK